MCPLLTHLIIVTLLLSFCVRRGGSKLEPLILHLAGTLGCLIHAIHLSRWTEVPYQSIRILRGSKEGWDKAFYPILIAQKLLFSLSESDCMCGK